MIIEKFFIFAIEIAVVFSTTLQYKQLIINEQSFCNKRIRRTGIFL